MKTARMTKKEARSIEDFRRRFEALMIEVGGTPDPNPLNAGDWTVQTRAGSLQLMLPRFDVPGFRTIFGRFADTKRARTVAWVNPYSGKWNHHYSGADNADYLTSFAAELRGLLVNPSA